MELFTYPRISAPTSTGFHCSTSVHGAVITSLTHLAFVLQSTPPCGSTSKTSRSPTSPSGAKGGGRALVDEDGYLTGAPELIIEIAASSAAYDLHSKKTVYRRNGTQEYLVLVAYEQEVRWFRWHNDGREEEILPDGEGVLRSQILPGLWLDPKRFWQEDLAGLLAVLQQGLESEEHARFVASAEA